MRRRLTIAGCVLGLALAVGLVTPAGAQFVSNYLGRTFTSTATANVNGVKFTNNYARLDLGQGANDYLYSNGTGVGAAGEVSAAGGFTSSTAGGNNGFALTTSGARVDLGPGASDYIYSDGTNIGTPAVLFAGGTQSWIGSTQVRIGTGGALPSCYSGNEGIIQRQASTGGTGTLTQTRFCLCVSDGAASPVYSWRNLVSGTAGNSTTCNP